MRKKMMCIRPEGAFIRREISKTGIKVILECHLRGLNMETLFIDTVVLNHRSLFLPLCSYQQPQTENIQLSAFYDHPCNTLTKLLAANLMKVERSDGLSWTNTSPSLSISSRTASSRKPAVGSRPGGYLRVVFPGFLLSQQVEYHFICQLIL